MAHITIKTNLPQVANQLKQKLENLTDKDYLLRPVCVDMIDLMTQRIHEQGAKSDGSKIGTYSSGYLKQRQRAPYNRTGDSKVIISLTRQLEGDWSVIATPNGYGVGFKNPFNFQKARWAEDGHEATTVAEHTRKVKNKNGETVTISVRAHQRSGWQGYGEIFSLSADELQHAKDLIESLTNNALK